jgi:zinc homeostasis transcription factor Zap1-like protein
MLSKEDVLLEQHSITCKLCGAKFESLDDMQRHVLTEHMQKGDYQIPSENVGK